MRVRFVTTNLLGIRHASPRGFSLLYGMRSSVLGGWLEYVVHHAAAAMVLDAGQAGFLKFILRNVQRTKSRAVKQWRGKQQWRKDKRSLAVIKRLRQYMYMKAYERYTPVATTD
jgi:hypothetical protein